MRFDSLARARAVDPEQVEGLSENGKLVHRTTNNITRVARIDVDVQ